MFNDNSTAPFFFDTSGIVNEDTTAIQVWKEKITDQTTDGSMGKKLVDNLKLKRTDP